MADNAIIAGAFAQHYRTGKFVDLRLVAQDGTVFGVHKLVVCSHSPILDTQAAQGATDINTTDNATCLGQMIEWMYGIDDKELLIERKSVAQVTAMGSSVMYGEILTLSDLAKIAEKYQLPKLQYQATELVGQLVENLTSLPCILDAVLHLAPEGAKGNVQKILTSRALDLTQAPGDAALATHGARSRKHSDGPIPTPVSSHGAVSEHGECEPSVNINRWALRSATTPSQPARQYDTDSDAPLAQQSSKRKRQNGHHSAVNIPAPDLGGKMKQMPPLAPSQHTLQVQVPRHKIALQPMKIHQRSKIQDPKPMSEGENQISADIAENGPRHVSASIDAEKRQMLESKAKAMIKPRQIRRNEPFRISTALPENNPPKGPHCHCKAASTDPTLLPCADCGNKYHPRCVGKGRYAQGTYAGNPTAYMLKDLDLFGQDKPFKCGDCEAGFFGVR